KREVEIYPGDSNIEIHKLLESARIKQTEATFCLLDQRTFQCEWQTVEALAKYKTQGSKIELFYFLANSWLGRTFAAQKRDLEMIEKWWGRDDWQTLRTMKSKRRAEAFVNRFKEELGYRSVQPWPIYEKISGGGNIMYYMIHATDHDEAPKLMRRAYGKAVWSTQPAEQTSFQFE
ncbi:MAG: three-Cys-motif partner protein TcmP, partial [Blastocatellia bacterium]